MDKKGVTLIELLAAIVLFAIVTVLVTTILSTIIRANKDIQITSQANVQGNYLVTAIETQLSRFELDMAVPPVCTETSCILTSTVRFLLIDNELVINQDFIQLTLSQELNGVRMTLENLTTATIVSNNLYTIDYFDLNLSIASTTANNKLRIQVTIELIDENMKSFIYLASVVYEIPE